MKKVEAILFDLGNVLVHIDILNFPRALGFGDTKQLEPVVPDLLRLQQQYERGEIHTEEFFAAVSDVLPNSYTREELEKAFSTIICEPIDGMAELVAQVCRSYRTALVSNTSEFHYTQSLQQVPVLHLLEKHYTSYTLKALKPEQKFYERVLADLRCSAHKVVFIDDMPQNVDGACTAGMIGIQFTSPSQLVTEFRRIGVEI